MTTNKNQQHHGPHHDDPASSGNIIFCSGGKKLPFDHDLHMYVPAPSAYPEKQRTDQCTYTYIKIHIHTYIHTYKHTCLLLLISMLWQRQAIFESKRDKLSSSAECRIRTHQGLGHQIASRLNARWQTDWAIEDQAKNLNSTARPYDQRAFSPLDPTAVWHSQLALAVYMFVVVNFDALAQASDIRIERRQTYIHTYIHVCCC